MTDKTDNQNAVDMVRMGFEESTRNLHFRVGFNRYGDGLECALEAIRSIGSYNEFDGDVVAEALIPFMNCISYPGIEVGREGSPVIYISLNDEKYKDALQSAMEIVYADEVDWEGRGNLTLRVWFD